jgi:hypothetical protein
MRCGMSYRRGDLALVSPAPGYVGAHRSSKLIVTASKGATDTRDQPPAGATASALEGVDELPSQRCFRISMFKAWPRLGVELAVEDLSGQTFGQRFELFVDGRPRLSVCTHVGFPI